MWNKIFKKSLIEKYNITFPDGLNYEDYCFFFKYFSASKCVYFIQEKLYNYVRRQGSIMNVTFQGSEKAMDHLKIMPNIYHFLIEHDLWNTWESAFYNCFLSCFYFSLFSSSLVPAWTLSIFGYGLFYPPCFCCHF